MGGYSDGAPWHFKGKALYQLSLVRVDEAKKYVPPELPLVNFFGWTLGGFYLARYSHSPVGPFEEMVALAGLAWNFPTSCAWAARVYVNSREARDHGIKEVGLPSRLASFRAVPLPQLKASLPAGRAQPAANGVAAKTADGIHGGGSSSSSGIRETASGGDAAGTSSTGGSSSSSSSGGSANTYHDTILDRTLAKFEKTNHSWWDHHYHQHNWFTSTSSKPARSNRQRKAGDGGSGSSSSSRSHGTVADDSSRGGRSKCRGSTAAGRELGPGTWAVELRNEERQRRGGLLAAIFARGRGGKQTPCRGLVSGPVCRVELPPQPKGQGPRVSMCLPSFSGATPDYPGFLQYNLQLQANIRPVPPARLAFPPRHPKQDQDSSEVLDLVLGGRPLVCLEFGNMEMEVQAPEPWYPRTSKAQAP